MTKTDHSLVPILSALGDSKQRFVWIIIFFIVLRQYYFGNLIAQLIEDWALDEI